MNEPSASQRSVVATTAGVVSLEKLGYQWSDDGAVLTVTLPLRECVTIEQLEFLEASLKLRLKGLSQTFIWNLQTYASLRAEHCSAKLRKKRIVLKLEKLRDQAWPRLRR